MTNPTDISERNFNGINYICLIKNLKNGFYFYLDVNMTIHFDINPLLNLSEEKNFSESRFVP